MLFHDRISPRLCPMVEVWVLFVKLCHYAVYYVVNSGDIYIKLYNYVYCIYEVDMIPYLFYVMICFDVRVVIFKGSVTPTVYV